MVLRTFGCFLLIMSAIIAMSEAQAKKTTKSTAMTTATTPSTTSVCAEQNWNCRTGYCNKTLHAVSDRGCSCTQCTCASDCQTGRHCDQTAPACNPCNLPLPCPTVRHKCVLMKTKKHCICARGTTGRYCEYTLADPCASYPCINGGTCKGDANGYTCACPAGYRGKQCQTSGDPCSSVVCKNGGHCISVLDDSRGVCKCTDHWQGAACEQPNLLTIRKCSGSGCSGECYKAPANLHDPRYFTLHEDSTMTVTKCKNMMDNIHDAEFFILAGSSCYTGSGVPIMGRRLSYTNCEKECPGDSVWITTRCGDAENVILFSHPYTREPTQCNPTRCGASGAGYCVEEHNGYSCVCRPGASGIRCQIIADPCKDFCCQNGGTCMPTEDGSQARCLCKSGSSGAKCEEADRCYFEAGSCKNGGTCVNSENSTAGFFCTCLPQYTGDHCESYKACSSSPCAVGSRCVDTAPGRYACTCALGWEGTDCDVDINECDEASQKSPIEVLCENGGTCNNTMGSYTCLCVPGTFGFNCSINPDDCEKGYIGPDKNKYPNLCNYKDKGAECIDGYDTYTCKCSPGMNGGHCMEDIDECADAAAAGKVLCENFGTCVNTIGSYHCDCIFGTFGFNCSINPDDCEISKSTIDGVVYPNECIARDKNATCTDGFGTYNCSCTPQWTGEHCLTDFDECAADPQTCLNFGTCVNTPGDYHCLCLNGTSGRHCEINPDDCIGVTACNKLDDKAKCTDGIGKYTCTCGPGYTMQYCDLEIIIYEVLQLIGGGNTNEAELIAMLRDLIKNPSLMKDLVPFIIGLKSSENRTRMSWDVEDLFLWIVYEERTLDLKKDLFKWNDVVLGNCFTFNHFNSTERLYRMRSSGAQGGLKAAVKLNSPEYLPWTETTAIMTFIHPNKETIFSESPRYNAAPSAMTTIQTKESRFKRLGGRYGRCIKSASEVASYYYAGSYTTDGCLRSCYQDEVKKACECMDSRYPMPSHESACDLPDRKCVDSITAKGDVSTWADCKCPLPCENSQFDSSYTVVPFVRSRSKCNAYTAKQRNDSICNDPKAEADYVIINVYVPRLTIDIFEERPAWTVNRIIGTIGGLGGVVCGLNLITLLEFAYFIFWKVPMILLFNRKIE